MVRVGYDLALPNQLWRGGGGTSPAPCPPLPHPCSLVCTGVYVLQYLFGKLQSSQNNDITHVFKWDLPVLEVSRNLQFWWPFRIALLVRHIQGIIPGAFFFCVPRSVAMNHPLEIRQGS